MTFTIEAGSGEDLVQRVLGDSERTALVDSPACFVGMKAFAPGEVFGNHYHDTYDEFFAVVSGEVVVWQGRSIRTTLRAGASLLCLRGTHHRLANERSTPAALLYVKTPHTVDDTHWVDWTPEAHS